MLEKSAVRFFYENPDLRKISEKALTSFKTFVLFI